MDSDDEIFLTQNTFSQEPFSPELNLEELVGDFRNNVFYLTPRQKYKSTDEGMIPINIDNLQFGCQRIKMSVSFNGRKPETVIRSFSFVSYFYFHC